VRCAHRTPTGLADLAVDSSSDPAVRAVAPSAGQSTVSPERRRRLWLLFAAAWLVPATLEGFETYMQGMVAGQGPASWRSVVWQGSDWLIVAALSPLIFLLGRKLPLQRPRLGLKLLIHFGAALLLCVVWASAGAWVAWLVRAAPPQASRLRFLLSWLLTTLPWGVFMYFAMLGIGLGISFFLEAREREAHAARLAAQLAEARLGALRMQLHPHFLFNSLNAITVLVRDNDTKSAARMLELLSDVLRQVLRSDRAHEVMLSEELGFIEQYLLIEQVRFSDRLRVSFAVDSRVMRAAVPGFVLQPLVENALRHGLAKRTDAGVIEIEAQRQESELVLRVRDDGPGIDTSGERREGVGLANTRQRLLTLYGASAGLELSAAPGGGTIATVRLPYRELRERATMPESDDA
jgi:two-component system LytT family sensor kinase